MAGDAVFCPRCQLLVSGRDEGCGRSFPFKTSPDLCAKCKGLAELEEKGFGPDSPEYKALEGYPQCEGCGAAMKRLQGSMCGNCHAEVGDEQGQAAKLAQQARAQHMAAQVKLHERQAVREAEKAKLAAGPEFLVPVAPVPKPVLVGVQPGGLVNVHSTAGFQVTRNALYASPAEQVTFEVGVKYGKARRTDENTGTFYITVSSDTAMPDVMDQVIKHCRDKLARHGGFPYTDEHCELRFPNNKTFETKTEVMMAGEFYMHYNTPQMRQQDPRQPI